MRARGEAKSGLSQVNLEVQSHQPTSSFPVLPTPLVPLFNTPHFWQPHCDASCDFVDSCDMGRGQGWVDVGSCYLCSAYYHFMAAFLPLSLRKTKWTWLTGAFNRDVCSPHVLPQFFPPHSQNICEEHSCLYLVCCSIVNTSLIAVPTYFTFPSSLNLFISWNLKAHELAVGK